jgi:hypothetical protein
VEDRGIPSDERKRSVFLIASGGGENEMKKRIIFIGLCFVLLLVFVSSSYGGEDPKYKLKAHPWEEMNLCPPQDTTDISCDETPSSSAACVWVIEVLGNRIILMRNFNYMPRPRTPDQINLQASERDERQP